MHLWRHVVGFLHGITVEPMFLIYYVSSAILNYSTTNLLLQKACRPDATSEPYYSTSCPDENEAQKVLIAINSWKPILEYTVPVVFVILLGTWSDTHGKRRKPLCFVPLIGEIAVSIYLIFCTYVWSVSPELTAALQAIIRGGFGGTICFALGALTYISDITTVENRSWRLGIITALSFIGSPLGIALGGVLRSNIGFFYVFMLCTVLDISALIFGILLIKNIACEDSKLKTFEGICNPSQFILSVKMLFRKRTGNKRLVLWLSGFTAPLFAATFFGESAVSYLFLRNKFNMSEVEAGYVSAYKLITIFVGTIISTIICSKVLKWRDEVIGGLGNLTQIIAAIAMCFAAYKWQLYTFPLLDLMHGSVFTAGRSITSKVVDGNELAQVNSVIGVVDTLVPVVVFPAYSFVYRLTIDVMPGAFYLLSVFIAFITLIMFTSIYILDKREIKNQSSDVKI